MTIAQRSWYLVAFLEYMGSLMGRLARSPDQLWLPRRARQS
jgi:hypothetical protein